MYQTRPLILYTISGRILSILFFHQKLFSQFFCLLFTFTTGFPDFRSFLYILEAFCPILNCVCDIPLCHMITGTYLFLAVHDYNTSDGALYTLAPSSLSSIYRLFGSFPNNSNFFTRLSALVSSSPCSLTNQSRNCIVRKSFT